MITMDTKKLRQKILDLAISGKLVPQDPNDEPASVLLERIRAEKERLIAEGKIKRPKKSKSSSAESHYQNFEPPFPIPNSWEWVRLEELCCRFSTGPFGSALHKHDYCTEGTPLINPTNIKEGRISISAIKRVCPDKVSELFRYILNENDIILARRGDLSKCAVISEEQAGWICGTGSFYLHLISISPRFFQIVYSSNYCQDYLKSESIGGTMDNLNQSLLSEFLIPIPPLSEQLRICCQVDDINCHIEDIEYSGFICMKTIESVKSHILDLAMQGKLVPQDPADEPAADMLRRVNPKAKIITDNPHYPQLPDNWVLVPLEDITEYEQPQPYIVQDTSYSDRYTIPVLTAGKSFILGYTNEDFGVYENVPAIIFDDFTTDSRLVNFPFKVKSSAMKIIQVKHGLNIEYIALFMSITRLMGETHKRYWISEYSKILIPIPPLKEQDRIVERVNVLYHELYKIISVLSA